MERTQSVAKSPSTVSSFSKDAMVTQFFEKFGAALTAADVKTIATLWGTPSFVLADGMSRAVITSDEVKKFFAGAKDQYASRGINEAIPDIRKLNWLTDRMVVAEVRWPYLNAQGAEVGEESSTYTLRLDDDGKLRIYAVAMHGAMQSH